MSKPLCIIYASYTFDIHKDTSIPETLHVRILINLRQLVNTTYTGKVLTSMKNMCIVSTCTREEIVRQFTFRRHDNPREVYRINQVIIIDRPQQQETF